MNIIKIKIAVVSLRLFFSGTISLQDSLIMMTDTNGALFPLSKNFLGTVKDPAWTVSNLSVIQLYPR